MVYTSGALFVDSGSRAQKKIDKAKKVGLVMELFKAARFHEADPRTAYRSIATEWLRRREGQDGIGPVVLAYSGTADVALVPITALRSERSFLLWIEQQRGFERVTLELCATIVPPFAWMAKTLRQLSMIPFSEEGP